MSLVDDIGYVLPTVRNFAFGCVISLEAKYLLTPIGDVKPVVISSTKFTQFN